MSAYEKTGQRVCCAWLELFCLGRINSAYYSTLVKVDIFVVFTTPTFCCQSLRTVPHWTFTIAAFDAVTYAVF